MASVQKPGARRHSFASFAGTAEEHQHQHIPTCETSHPDNPIPVEPKTMPLYNLPPTSRSQFASMAVSPRSSGESLHLATDNDTNNSDSDSPLTPSSTIGAIDELTDKFRSLPIAQPPKPVVTKKRRASTTYASNAEDIRRIIGDGSGTKFLQKYCCGEGCCMVEALPLHGEDPGFAPIQEPDNAAFRFLGLNLRGLSRKTPLTKVPDVSPAKVSFAPLRRESLEEKFPEEAKHRHDAEHVNRIAPDYMKPHPPYSVFSAPVYGARELTKPGAEKRTFHFDIDVTDYPAEGGVDFKVGGAIGICPPNDPAVVHDVMDQLGIPRFQRDKPLRIVTTGGRWPTIWGDEEARELVTTRREILTWTVDITSQAPAKPLLRLLAEHASDPTERQILLYICSAQGQAAFCDLRTGPHITLQQLLHAFPSAKPPLEALCGVLNQLMPRFYSLSNDPHVSSAREGLAGRRLIEVAVTIHETPNFTGSPRNGVGSGFMERIAAKFVAAEEEAAHDSSPPASGVAGRALDLRVPMFRGLMSNPLSREFASDGPMVLIGAGVGMAPFRGFILNRLKNANCANKIWLIQGIRDASVDELYRGELGDHEMDIKKVVQSRVKPTPSGAPSTTASSIAGDDLGPLEDTLPPAEARESQPEIVAKYVQDEVRLQADIVWFVINAPDGRIFVCGSTRGMGEGVEQALVDVAMDKGGLDAATARDFWEGKKKAMQYIAETW